MNSKSNWKQANYSKMSTCFQKYTFFSHAVWKLTHQFQFWVQWKHKTKGDFPINWDNVVPVGTSKHVIHRAQSIVHCTVHHVSWGESPSPRLHAFAFRKPGPLSIFFIHLLANLSLFSPHEASQEAKLSNWWSSQTCSVIIQERMCSKVTGHNRE